MSEAVTNTGSRREFTVNFIPAPVVKEDAEWAEPIGWTYEQRDESDSTWLFEKSVGEVFEVLSLFGLTITMHNLGRS